MPHVVLQPASNREARKHYRNTIASAVPLGRIRPHVSAEMYDRLQELYPNGRTWIWGATPGSQNTRSVQRMDQGDPVLFYRKGVFISKAHVTLFDMENRSLAVELWGATDDGVTWEHVFFLDKPEEIAIPYHDLWEVAQHGPEDVLRGLTVLPEQKSHRVLAAFDELAAGAMTPQVDEDEYRQSALKLDQLDKKRETLARTEQTFLRRQLFGNSNVGRCGICGERFPVELLVAAHIKKRAECSPNEKRDYENNVMPMCAFGCDDLFERGFLTVKAGRVVQGAPSQITDPVRRHLERVSGRECEYYHSDNQRYFAWHAKNTAS